MTEVTAAVIVSDGKFLICRRPEGKNHAGLWEFPGGKIEPGESGEACIVRECEEELAITLEVLGEIGDVVYTGIDSSVHIYFYKCRIQDGEPILLEHSACRMIGPEETGQYEFCPADKMLLDKTDMRTVVYAS